MAAPLPVPPTLPVAATPSGTASATAPPPSAPPSRTEPPASPSATKKPPASAAPLDLKRKTGTEAVALTFDDGPHPAWTPRILDELRAAKVSATFCVVGIQAERHPDLIARIVREGHTLCNHTWRHEFDLGTLPKSKIRANLERTNQAILRAAPDARIKYFRHPGGMWTPEAIAVARDLGMVSLHWDVDPRDWEQPGAEAIRNRVLKQVRPGSIVLLHDGGGDRSGTLRACKALLPELKSRFRLVALK